MIGRSKSSAHRLLQAQEQRNAHPESSHWETEAGYAWLRLMVFATLYQFGLKSGVGAEALSQFFKTIRIDGHVGVSPTVLREQITQLEHLLPQYQAECENSITQQTRKIVAGLDETFFGDFMILVLMDLRSGYLLLEEITEDRCFDTWYAKTTPRLESLGIEVSHAISDRAKALIKMAVSGFCCESGADVFHAQQDPSRWLGARLGKRISQAEKALEILQIAKDKALKKGDEAALRSLETDKITAEQTLGAARQSQQDYHENLQGISDEVHPFSVLDNSVNNAEKIVQRLEGRAQAFEALAEDQGIADHNNTLKKLRNQFGALAVSVSFWWLWVHETLLKLGEEGSELGQWLTTTLLPVTYWHHKVRQTKNRKTKDKYLKAWKSATAAFKAHPLSAQLPTSEIQRWLLWAESMSRQFQRSSSAVEGRNGCLSQMYHKGRGLSGKRLKALTVIHNYDIKREDGTTAAMRLFNTEFPDLFLWGLDRMGDLPLPRKSRERRTFNSLSLLDVPS